MCVYLGLDFEMLKTNLGMQHCMKPNQSIKKLIKCVSGILFYRTRCPHCLQKNFHTTAPSADTWLWTEPV